MKLHERIATQVLAVIAGARGRGEREITITARDVADALGLTDRTPAICSKLGSIAFHEAAGVRLVRRGGPHQGARASFTFVL